MTLDMVRHHTRVLDVFDHWAATYAIDHGLTESTIRNYRSAMRNFNKWAEEKRGRPARAEDVTVDNFREFLLSRAGVSDMTFRTHFAAYRIIFKWMTREGYIALNPADLMPSPRKTKNLAHPKARVKADQLPDFFEAAKAFHPRDEAVFIFLAQQGRRQSEMDITWDDVSFEPAPRRIYGQYTFTEYKKRRNRVTHPLTATTREALLEWREEYRRLAVAEGILRPDSDIPGNWYVFPAFRPGPKKRLNPLSFVRLGDAIDRVKVKLGITSEWFGTHALRRFCADYWIKRKGVRYAKTILNHDSEKTTEIYNDEKEDIDLLGDAFIEEAEAPADQASAPAVEPVQTGAKVINLADRFGRGRTA